MNLTIEKGVIDLDSKEGDEILTALILSLFTDARATEEEWEQVRDWENSKRGYWGDKLSSDFMGSGSKLWLLRRSPADEATRERARTYVKEALRWMVDDGLLSSIESDVSWAGDDLMIKVTVNNKEPINLKYKR